MKNLIAVVSGFLCLLAPLARAQECTSSVVGHSSVHVDYDSALSAAGGPGAIVFTGSGDGTLRALDAQSARALWSFVPDGLVGAQSNSMTDLAVLRFDSNNDGLIDAGAGDRVWLYFGLKRGGARYYALDVTARSPRLLWTVGTDTIADLGEAWSTPTITRVHIGGAAQNGEHFVIVIGGGYEADGAGTGGPRNRLFILDAASGRVLWSAGDTPVGGGSDLSLPRMTHSIAARVTALDLDGDEFADRLYAADVGARIWRFDLWNGRSRDQLITGGIFASLGAVEPLSAPAAAADARRFFNAPDVALMHAHGKAPWLNIAIGSGDSADTVATHVRDRFYSLRDHEPFTKRSQASYDDATPVFDENLVDITDNPIGTALPEGSPGWKLNLEGKVLSESLTVNGVVLFTTYEPAAASACEADGSGEVYAVSVNAGEAALDLNRDGEVTEEDGSAALEEGGIPGAPQVEVVRPGAPGTENPGNPGDPEPGEPPPPGQGAETRCYAGTELMTACMAVDTVVRTFWKRTLVN